MDGKPLSDVPLGEIAGARVVVEWVTLRACRTFLGAEAHAVEDADLETMLTPALGN
jgi:hypothetical protein